MAHLGVRVDESLKRSVEQIAAEYDTSNSEVCRAAIRDLVRGNTDVIADEYAMEVQNQEVVEKSKPRTRASHFKTNIQETFTEMLQETQPPEILLAFRGQYAQYLGKIHAAFRNEPDLYCDHVQWLNNQFMRYWTLHPDTDAPQQDIARAAVDTCATILTKADDRKAAKREVGRYLERLQENGMIQQSDKDSIKRSAKNVAKSRKWEWDPDDGELQMSLDKLKVPTDG